MTENMIEKVAANNLPNLDDLRDIQGKKSDLHQKKGSAHCCTLPGVFYSDI